MSNIYVQEPPTEGKVKTQPWIMMKQCQLCLSLPIGIGNESMTFLIPKFSVATAISLFNLNLGSLD